MSPKRESRAITVGDALRSYVKRLDVSGKLREAAVIDAWPTVVGDRIGAHTRLAGLRSGELFVGVDSPVWANELSAMSESLRVSLNQELGEELVRAVRFTVSREVEQELTIAQQEADADRRYGGDRIEPIQLTPEEKRAIENSVMEIADEGLREAALKATIRDLEWKKGLEASNVAQGQAGGSRDPKTSNRP